MHQASIEREQLVMLETVAKPLGGPRVRQCWVDSGGNHLNW